MRSTASLASDTVRVIPGELASLQVNLHNPGDIVEAYRVEVVGLPLEWVQIQPPEVTLYPGTSTTVTVTVSPPRTPEAAEGEIPFATRVTPSENSDATVVEEALLIIEPFHELSSQLQPPVRTGRRGARFRLESNNRGNTVEPVVLRPAGVGDRIRAACRPESIEIPAGSTGETRVRVRARRLLWWGAQREHRFGVLVSNGDGAATRLDATYIQRPVISAGLLKLLAALLALVLALIGLWFGVFRPAVRSAAREVVAEQHASLAAADAAAQQRPAVPNSSAGAGGNAGGGGSAKPSSAASPGDQRSIALSLRTKPGSQGEQNFRVDDDKQFLVTDLVVDNVQGDEGILRVTANGISILSLALENFRSQDYHSVTQIKIPAKAQLKFEVTCRTVGKPPNAPVPTTCFEELHATGTMATVSP